MNNSPIKIIEAKKGWYSLRLSELFAYKDLLYFMIVRDIKILYKQTILGFAWAIINPVFSMIIFTVVFGKLAKIPSDGIPYPLFSYTALLPWTYFSGALSGATNSLIGQSGVFTKVYFPRIFIPLTPVIAKLLDLAIAFILLLFLMLFYSVTPTLSMLFFPIFILMMILTASGLGFWLSSLAIQYRDVKFATVFLIQILMYVAPVIYPASLILDKFGVVAYRIYGIYPMVGVIEGFRASLLGVRPIPWDLVLVGGISSIILFVTGFIYFKQSEKTFADVA